MPSADRNPAHVFPAMGAKIEKALAELNHFLSVHHPEFKGVFGEGFRSTERQQALYAQGRTSPGSIVTYKDGVKNKSNHQSSLAVDLWLTKNGQIVWDAPDDVWQQWGHCLRAQGLKWGGDWSSFKDEPHGEWDTSDTATYTLAHAWQIANGLK